MGARLRDPRSRSAAPPASSTNRHLSHTASPNRRYRPLIRQTAVLTDLVFTTRFAGGRPGTTTRNGFEQELAALELVAPGPDQPADRRQEVPGGEDGEGLRVEPAGQPRPRASDPRGGPREP